MFQRLRLVVCSVNFRLLSSKKHIDYSQVPALNEQDLEEKQVKGSGPGGQKVSKTSSCIVLKHIPTGIVVKCQETRSVLQNKKIARLHLITKLDNTINGENSVEAQIKRLENKKRGCNEQKREKLNQLKQKWKELQNIE
uniref:Prokaryotic-type class I peptide chain release factors domain-containing protein n=1 Tax=Dendroctonus ponderosae TaxID=77166 RepID=J3JUQ8_DENPD|nr:unknown [Dendroctonus ponderosae]